MAAAATQPASYYCPATQLVLLPTAAVTQQQQPQLMAPTQMVLGALPEENEGQEVEELEATWTNIWNFACLRYQTMKSWM